MQTPKNLLHRFFPPATPPATTSAWQRVDPSPSTRLPHPKPGFKTDQRVHIRAEHDAASTLQQQSYWIKGWRWDPVYGRMTYLLAYTPGGRAYGSEAEGSLLAA